MSKSAEAKFLESLESAVDEFIADAKSHPDYAGQPEDYWRGFSVGARDVTRGIAKLVLDGRLGPMGGGGK